MSVLRAISQQVPDSVHHAFTAVSMTALLGWIVGALPTFSLCVTALWGALKCVETILTIKIKRRELNR